MVLLLYIKHHWRLSLCVPVVVYIIIMITGLTDEWIKPRFKPVIDHTSWMAVAAGNTTNTVNIRNETVREVSDDSDGEGGLVNTLEAEVGFGYESLVTMFTTVKDRACRREIHNRTLRNWAALRPYLSPVLFVPKHEVNSSPWLPLAASRGWSVYPDTQLRKKIPLLVPMFKTIINETSTPFIGYANADILFDPSLLRTLKRLTEVIDVNNTTILIVGRRRNANITKYDLGDGANLSKITNLKDLIQLFHGMAQDYFIISRRGLPWKEIPEFVVGRNGYDNWLVVKGQDWNIMLIDASQTILAVHQVGIDGISSGFHTNKDGTIDLNWQLVRGFKYGRGRTECSPHYTMHGCTGRDNSTICDSLTNITLMNRPLHPFKQGNRVTMRAKC
jgi:hypothetical protein